MSETVIATVDVSGGISPAKEQDLAKEASLIERQAMDVQVSDERGYSTAGEMLKQIKTFQGNVKDYWEPLRVSAKKTYDDILSKKKQMLGPAENAEKILKKKMGEFRLEQERVARELEERRRKELQAQIDRQLEEAAKFESQGNKAEADYMMSQAEMYDQLSNVVSFPAAKPKVGGISTSKTWKITKVDVTKVPVFFEGVEIRPVDTGTVLRMIKARKGDISIPGIEFEEDVCISARA